MSEAAIATIVGGCITITTMIIGFLTLWLKLKYGIEKAETAATTAAQVATRRADVVENKLDHNTVVSTEAKDAAVQASEHSAACDEDRQQLAKVMGDHDVRITALEGQMVALKMSVDGVIKSVDSTRHEMRGHLQTVIGKLDILGMALPRPTPVVVASTPTPAPAPEEKK